MREIARWQTRDDRAASQWQTSSVGYGETAHWDPRDRQLVIVRHAHDGVTTRIILAEQILWMETT